MLEYNQEMYSNDVNRHNLDPFLMKSLNKIIKAEGYTTYSINIRDVSTDGGNFLSTLKEVDIKGIKVNKKKETNLFIKQCLPENDSNIVCPKSIFLKEVFTYTELADQFSELQKEFNVPDKEKYKFVKYYNDDNDDSLIFDNMIRKGFKICNRFDVPPLKVLELSVQELAKFHGISMALKQYRPDFYRTKIQTVKHSFLFNENGNIFVASMCNNTLRYLEDERKIKVENFSADLLNKFNRYVNENECKFKCLCHGDYRMNNILVKEANGEAAVIIPIDYQLIYYGSPVTDLLYMIFMATDQQFRKNYMEHLKKMYFEHLKKYLRYFKIDVELVYTQKDFENDFKKQLDYGFMMALLVLPFQLASEDDVPELNSDLKTMNLDENFKRRITEIVDDVIGWGYL